jgi:predicted anti-sigma-YlaC factor YlaD
VEVSDVAQSCEWAREQIEHDLGESLVGRDARDLEQHLERCGSCRKVRARQEALVRTFRELPRVSAPPDLFARIQSEIDRRESAPRRFRLLRRVAPIAAAAIAATVVAMALFQRSPRHLVIVPDSSYCQNLEDYQLRDRLFQDNPFFGDVDPADAYRRILGGGWK